MIASAAVSAVTTDQKEAARVGSKGTSCPADPVSTADRQPSLLGERNLTKIVARQ